MRLIIIIIYNEILVEYSKNTNTQGLSMDNNETTINSIEEWRSLFKPEDVDSIESSVRQEINTDVFAILLDYDLDADLIKKIQCCILDNEWEGVINGY